MPNTDVCDDSVSSREAQRVRRRRRPGSAATTRRVRARVKAENCDGGAARDGGDDGIPSRYWSLWRGGDGRGCYRGREARIIGMFMRSGRGEKDRWCGAANTQAPRRVRYKGLDASGPCVNARSTALDVQEAVLVCAARAAGHTDLSRRAGRCLSAVKISLPGRPAGAGVRTMLPCLTALFFLDDPFWFGAPRSTAFPATDRSTTDLCVLAASRGRCTPTFSSGQGAGNSP